MIDTELLITMEGCESMMREIEDTVKVHNMGCVFVFRRYQVNLKMLLIFFFQIRRNLCDDIRYLFMTE